MNTVYPQYMTSPSTFTHNLACSLSITKVQYHEKW